MKYTTGLVPSPPDIRDYVLTAMVKPLKTSAPDVCLKWMDYVTPVKYQAQLGSCAAFSGGAAVELYNVKEYGKEIDLSEQFLYGEAKKIDGLSEEGTYLRAILKVLKNTGVCEESYFPYEGRYPTEYPAREGAYTNAEIYKIQSYAMVYPDIEPMKQAIYQNGPLLTGILVYESFENTGADGIVTNPLGKVLGGHAITIVGYDNTGFIVKNSWSTYWGRNGYCTIPWNIWTSISLNEVWSIVDIVGTQKKCPLFSWLFRK